MADHTPPATAVVAVIIVVVHTGCAVLLQSLWAAAPTDMQAETVWQWVDWVWFPTGLLFPPGNDTVLLLGGLAHCLGVAALVRWVVIRRSGDMVGGGLSALPGRYRPARNPPRGHKPPRDRRAWNTPGLHWQWPRMLAPCRTTGECVVVLVLGVLCAATAVTLLWHKAWKLDRALSEQSREWIAVPAVVTRSHIFSSTVDLGYEIGVKMTYEVAGRQHIHELYRFRSAAARRDLEAFRRDAGYEVGDTVRLYYNPLSPGEAALTHPAGGHVLTVTMVCACILAPLLLTGGFSGLRGRRIR